MADLPPNDIPPSLPTLPTPPLQSGSLPIPPVHPTPTIPEENADPDDDSAGNDLSAFSPFKILEKKGSVSVPVPPVVTPPVPIPEKKEVVIPPVVSPPLPPIQLLPTSPPRTVSPPVPPVSHFSPPVPLKAPSSTPTPPPLPETDLDRDELLKQAAEAPEHTFILPPLPMAPPVAAPTPTPPIKPPVPVPEKKEIVIPPVVPPPLPPVQPPIAPPKPSVPKPPLVKPNPLPVVPPLPTHPAPPLPTHPAPTLSHSSTPKAVEFPLHNKVEGPRSHLLFAVLGSVIGLILLIGGLYVLTDNGLRVPFLYPAISGVQGTASKASAQALAQNETHKSYQYQAIIALAQQPTGTSGGTVQATQIYSLGASVPQGEFSNQGAAATAHIDVTANANAVVPVVVRVSDKNFAAYFPTGTSNATNAVNPADIANTLLQPVLTPMSAETILKAVHSETAYQKASIANKAASLYTVGYDCTALQAGFPKGATLSGCTGTIAVYWKKPDASLAALPAATSVKATVTYKGLVYTYSADYRYSSWDQPLGSQAGDLVLINNVDLSTLSSPLSIESFVSSLGISFSDLPHDTSLDTGAAKLPITPTGLTITVPQAIMTALPPTPTQPASSAAKQRDVQRKHDLQDLQTALEAYKKDTGSYPVSAEEGDQIGSSQALFAALVPKYLTAMPVDPLKDTYYYLYISPTASSGSIFHLRSILEDSTDPGAVKGETYSYFDLYNS